MAGKRIVVPNYMPALDLNGGPVAGAKLYFYDNETTTLKAIYTSAALNVALPNPVIANAAGVFPSIFADEAEEFSVAITDADDNPITGLRNRDNITPSLAFLDGVEAPVSEAMASVLLEDTLAAARTTLGTDLATNVNFTASGTGATSRTVQDKGRDWVSVKDYGAIGDGFEHPLSERFATLAAAQIVYPFVTSLAQLLDYAGAQAAINVAGANEGNARCAAVYWPAGTYRGSNTLLVPNYIELYGDASGSVIDNQNTILAVPQFANKNATTCIGVTFRDLRGVGGTHFFKSDATSTNERAAFINVQLDRQTEANVEFATLQVSRFEGCSFLNNGGNDYCIKVTGFPCNANVVLDSTLTCGDEAALWLRGVDGFTMIGGRIESGGVSGKATIDLADGGVKCQSINFIGVYFEAGHEFLLKTDNNTKNCTFYGCKSSGAMSPVQADKFDTGTSIISLVDCFFEVGAVAPTNVSLSGINTGLTLSSSNVWSGKSSASGHVRLAKRISASATSVTTSLLTFTRPSGGSGGTNQEVLNGTLKVSATGSVGGFMRTRSKTLLVSVDGRLNNNLTIASDVMGDHDTSSNALDFTVSGIGGSATSVTLQVVAATFDAYNSLLTASFEWDAGSYTDGEDIVVSAA